MPTREVCGLSVVTEFPATRGLRITCIKAWPLDRAYISRVVYIYRIRYFPQAINDSDLRGRTLLLKFE
jgi:hypothetical protein